MPPAPSYPEYGSIPAAFRRSVVRHPEKPAILCDAQSWTYAQLDRLTESLAQRLSEAGLQPGERVATHQPNTLELAVTYLGCLKAGLVLVPLNARLKGPEIEYMLRHSGAAGYVGHPLLFPEFAGVRPLLSELRLCFITGEGPWGDGVRAYNGLLDPLPGAAALPEVGAAAAAVILYTSGTTARPKGVTHSHGTIVGLAQATRGLELDEHQITVVTSSMAHMLGFGLVLLGALLNGATAALLPETTPAAVLDACERHRCTHMLGLPTFFQALARAQSEAPRELSSAKYFFCGGDTVSPALQEAFTRALKRDICEAYGSTETVPVTYNRAGRVRVGSIGQVAEGARIRLLDPSGRDVATGEVGEICVQSPTLMTGYWNDPEATAAAIRDGWFHTGDLARCDAEGYYWFAGRTKQIIIRGGSNISPQEVEAALLEHPMLREAAVIGRPDRVWGEMVVAYVVTKEGERPAREELIRFAGTKLAAHKVPEEIVFRDSLPKNATGKMDRRALKEAEATAALAETGRDPA